MFDIYTRRVQYDAFRVVEEMEYDYNPVFSPIYASTRGYAALLFVVVVFKGSDAINSAAAIGVNGRCALLLDEPRPFFFLPGAKCLSKRDLYFSFSLPCGRIAAQLKGETLALLKKNETFILLVTHGSC